MPPAPYSCTGVNLPAGHSADEVALAATAEEIISERGAVSVIEELSRPIIHSFEPRLIPHLASAILESQDDSIQMKPITLSAEFLATPGPIHEILPTSLNGAILKTGCSTLDSLFRGGIPVGNGDILELSGTAGVGKTQLAIQLALMTAAPVSCGGLASSAVFAFTEGPPPIKRITEIDGALCERFGLEAGSLLSRVIVEKIDSVVALLHWAEVRLPYLLREADARIVLLDSVTALYRPDFADALSRANHLVAMAAALKRAASRVQGMCICINQVSQRFEIDQQTLSTTAPALGASWANCVGTRLFLKKREYGRAQRFARVLHSSYLPPTEGDGEPYQITEAGITSDS